MAAATTDRVSLLLQQKRPDLAEQEARRLLREAPNDAWTHTLLALALLQQHLPAEAKTSAEVALALDPLQAQAHYCLGMSLLAQQQSKLARQALRSALALIPFEPAYHAALGWTYFGEARWHLALASAEAGLSLDPTHPDCLNLRLRASSWVNQSAEGFADIQRAALRAAPNSELTHTNLGYTYLESGNFRQARHHLQEALRLNPTCSMSFRGLRKAHLGRFWLYRAAAWLSRLITPGLIRMVNQPVLWGIVSRLIYLSLWALTGWLVYRFAAQDALESVGTASAILIGVALLFPLMRLWMLTLLRLDPKARLLLTPTETVFSNVLLGVTVVVIVLTGAALLPTNGFTALPLMLFGLTVPVGGSRLLPAGSYHRASRWVAIAFAALGLYAMYCAAVNQSSIWETVYGYLLCLYLLVFTMGDWPE
ncbi:tetratricopeptide repeat protein [Hymenobacter koreensis]